MQAGLMRRRVLLQQRSTAVDETGSKTTAWTDVATMFAQITPMTGRESLSGQAIRAEVSHQIMVRYQPMFANPAAVAAMRAVYNGRYFNIHAAINENERNRQITLLCSEGLSDG